MAYLNFKMGNFANLPSTKKAGTVYITKDEHGMYVDISNDERVRINQIISYNTFTDFTTALQKAVPPYSTEAFYYIIEDNALLKYNTEYGDDWDPDKDGTANISGKWVQINSTADIQTSLDAVSNRVTTLENWRTGTIEPWVTTVNEDIAAIKEKNTEQDTAISNLQKEDTRLAGLIATETSERKSEITRVEGLISAEATKREEEDGKLRESITGISDDLAQEILDRAAADSTLDGKIAANTQAIENEASTRAEADEDLQKQIDANETAIGNEVTRATGVENKLREDLTATQGDLADEVTNRTNAVSAVQNALDAEVTRATGEEARIEAKINQEIIDRGTAISGLQEQIDDNDTDIADLQERMTGAEGDIANLQKADTDMKDYVDEQVATEKSARETAVAGVQKNLDDYKVVANGEISDLKDRATALEDRATALEGRATTLENDLAVEIQRATKAEKANADAITGLDGRLTDEIDRATKAEKANADAIAQLDKDLDAEVEAREAADTTINENIQANAKAIVDEKTRAEKAEADNKAATEKVASDLAAEIADRATDEAALQKQITDNLSKLNTEIANRTEKDTELAENISKNADAIVAEKERAEAAEEALGNRITNAIQTADAMKYQGTVASASALPTSGVEIGHTYKVTAEINEDNVGSVNINWHTTLGETTPEKIVRIGDLLIANGTETNGVLTSITWDHVPSGFVADYNPELTADGSAGVATLTLTRGDETTNNVSFAVVDGNESLKVSADNNVIYYSMEWGTF